MGVSTAQTNSSPPPKRTSSSQKFRSSCDNCSNSKVKCGQERPSCQRCVATGVSCHYSISRRMGKPPSSGRKQGTASRPKSSRKEAASPAASSPGGDNNRVDNNDNICNNDNNDIGMDGFAPAIDSTFMHNYTQPLPEPWIGLNYMQDQSSLSSASILDSECPAIADMFQPEQSPNPFDILNNSDFPWPDMTNFEMLSSPFSCTTQGHSMSGIEVGAPHPTARVSSSSSSASPALDHMRFNNGEEYNHDPIPCAKLVANVLNNFSNHSSFCNTRSGSAVPIKVDEALTTARMATAAFHKLLTCPCSSKPQNALSLSIIIQKILACYTAVIKRASNVDLSLSSSSSASSLAASFDISLDAPISIGAYQIDAEDEHRFKMQLVYNELRKVSKTIDAFTARFCDGGSINGLDEDYDGFDATFENPFDSGDSSRDFYHTIDRFLRSQLRRAIRDVSAIMSQSNKEIIGGMRHQRR